ncbi:MAG: hypothetical protein ACI914_001081 [Candidatus Marivariicella framensis]|jgi:hypothetical protein|tara:strand:+ start:972 stop:1454 length:483 start_codon:yes stop_codon:yes gene_type:complete
MILRIRTILDVENDVLRDIEIDETSLLKDLHVSITKSYGFEGKEMASFFKTNETWDQGDEMSLIDLGVGKDYSNESLNKLFNSENNRLLYVYDFLALWTFFIEVMEVSENDKNIKYPNLVFSQGEVPEDPPIKIFEESNSDNEESEENKDHNDIDYDEFY